MTDAVEINRASRKKELEEMFNKPIYELTNEDLDKYFKEGRPKQLKDGSKVISTFTSANSIYSYLSDIRAVHKQACEEAGVPYKELELTKDIIDYIDIKKLRSKTILYKEELMMIRKELIGEDFSGNEANFRDVSIFWLALLGAKTGEIETLKTDSIRKVDNKLEITFENGRKIYVTDEIMKQDILNATEEREYYSASYYEQKDEARIKKYDYETTDYLIKPIHKSYKNGKKKPNQPIKGVGKRLQEQLAKISDPRKIIDFEHLSTEDIRRSVIIQMILADPDITAAQLQTNLSKKQQSDLQWLKPAVKKMQEYENNRG